MDRGRARRAGRGRHRRPLNTRFKAAELAYILRRSGAKALFAAPFLGTDYVAELRKHEPELDALRTTVSLAAERGDADLSWNDFLDSGESVDEGAAQASVDRVTPETVSDIMFTSGTTGHPKGVVLTHGQSLRAYGWMAEQYTFRTGDVFLVVPPFFHCFGYKAGWLASFLHGVTVVPMAVFDTERALELIERERVSIMLGPPTIFQDLLAAPDRARRDTSSLRISMTGGTTIPEQLIHAMKNELSFDIVMSAYGLTEASALVTTTRLGDSPATVARGNGRMDPRRGRTHRRRRGQARTHAAGQARSRSAGTPSPAVTGTSRRPRPPRSPTTDGCAPVTSAAWTRRAISRSWTARRTCSSSGASTPTRPRSNA